MFSIRLIQTEIFIFIVIFLFLSSLAFSQVVINEAVFNGIGGDNGSDPSSYEWAELKNIGVENIDISTWEIRLGTYYELSALTQPVPPGGFVIVYNGSGTNFNTDFSEGNVAYLYRNLSGSKLGDSYGDISLYGTVRNSDNIKDYLAYGDIPSGTNYDHAIAANIWTENDYIDISGYSPGNSIEYDGSGDLSSDYFIQSNPSPGSDNSLPVFLTSFSASVIQNGILLRWSTASEVNNAGFYVCRSDNSDGGFDRITNLIPGAGNSDDAQTYQFVDRNVAGGETYYYQIEDVDINGITAKHQTISITFRTVERAGETPNIFTVSPGYPSPFGDIPGYSATFIKLNITKEMAKNPFTISIFNLLGQRVYQFAPATIHAGSHVLQWHGLDNHGNRLSAGPYFWVIRSKGIHEVRRVMLLR